MKINDPLKVDGVDYTPEKIFDLRKQLIVLRDNASENTGTGHWVQVLSETIALLWYLAQLEDKVQQDL